MLSTAARVGLGLGMLAVRAGPGAARLRAPGSLPLRYPQRGFKFFPRFFARMSPPRHQQQQQPLQGQPIEEKESLDGKPGLEHKQVDTNMVNPVSLPGTGVGMFGFGAGGGVDAIITTLIGITVVFFGGVAYVKWYKANVLNKIEAAFEPGYDPALELANHPGRGGE
ncbi:hypothetical protein FS749_003227, partial [Ceratobasidium sp. UAMH 11750]